MGWVNKGEVMTKILRERQRAVGLRPLVAALVALTVMGVVSVSGSGVASIATATCATPNTLDASGVNGGQSNFEIDAATVGGTTKKPVFSAGANLTLDGSSPCLDWTTSAAGAGNNDSLLTGVLAKADQPSGSGDDSFTQGTSEGDTTPTISSGSIPPNKSDLQKFGVYRESNASGKFLDLFWSRVNAPSGTVDMDFELNKVVCDGTATTCSSNGSGQFVIPLRSDGDRLITYDLANGGTNPTISIYTWSGDSSSGSWTNGTVISGAAGEALGSINFSSILTADGGGLGAKDPLTFGEVSISYKALFGSSGTSGCGSFGSVFLKSRSSNTFTDELKDFVAPEAVQITNCTTVATTATNGTKATAKTLSASNTIGDTATLSGASSPTGTMSFAAYGPFDPTTASSGDTCTDPNPSATPAVAGNRVYQVSGLALTGPDADGNYSASTTFIPTAPGRYEWKASYSGDPGNGASSGTCPDPDATELSYVKATPGLTTTLHDTTIAVGSSTYDGSSFTGVASGWPNPTGTVTYTVYTNTTCTTAATTGAGNQIDGQPAAVTVNGDGTIPNSGSVTFQATGDYYWQASYGGDDNYNAAKSPCTALTNEHLVVNQLNSTISTAQGWYPNDTATIDHSGGNVVFTLYKNDNTCSVGANIVYGPTGNKSVTGTGAGGTAPFEASTTNWPGSADSATVTPFGVTAVASGDKYYWKAAYTAGDQQHKNVTSSCQEVTTFTSLDNGSSVTSP